MARSDDVNKLLGLIGAVPDEPGERYQANGFDTSMILRELAESVAKLTREIQFQNLRRRENRGK